MEVILVGGTGRVGSLTCRALVSAGHEVVVCARKVSAIEGGDHIRPMGLDLHEPIPRIAEVFDQVDADAVIFTAGSRGKDLMQVDTLGAIKTIEAARRVGISRYVMLGSIYAADVNRWEDPEIEPIIDVLGDYYVAKNMADQHLIHSGLDYTIIEPGTLTEEKGTGRIEVSPSGLGRIPIPDVARCLADCIDIRQTIGHVYNILGGDTPIGEALIVGA